MWKSFLRWALPGVLASGVAGAASLELLKDIGDKDVLASSSPQFLGAVGNRGYFAATPFGGQPRLYRTDGTTDSTVPVTTGTTINRPSQGREIAGRLVFLANGNSDRPKEVWTTDGTDAGTVRLLDTGDFGSQYVWLGTIRESRGFFYLSGFGTPGPLYVTDGTVAGTRLLTTRQVSSAGDNPFDAAGNFYFWSSSGGLDYELWVSDGTIAGTRELISRSAIALRQLNRVMHLGDGAALVSGLDDIGEGVFSVDLASGAVTRLSNLTHLPRHDGVHAGSLHYFAMGHALWRTDGTPAGTFVLATDIGFSEFGETLMAVGGQVVFRRFEISRGRELWVTDGTVAGTQLLRESVPGPNGWVTLLASTGTRAFYAASETGGAGPVQFWVTDGTPGGTNPIPLGASSNSDLPSGGGSPWSLVAEGRVYFMIQHLRPGDGGWYSRLFATDLEGNSAVDLGPALAGYPVAVAVGNSLLFSNVLDPAGIEPWFTDGTPAGTQRLRDIAVSGQTNSADPKDFTLLGDRALFVADDGDSGRELWVTDGTPTGTTLVKDIAPGPASSSPGGLRNVGGLVYFVAGNGGVSDGGGGRLWRSDGTSTGTFVLGEVTAAAGGGSIGGCANWSTLFNGRVWFFGADDTSVGTELWSTDGTAAGTRREFLLPTGTVSAPYCELHTTANGLVFIRDTAPDTQLWYSDGTLAGTGSIPGVRPAGVDSGFASMSAPMIVANGMAYLLADGGDGLEPWRTDGTPAGTQQVADLTVGALGAQIYAAAAFGDGIVFQYASEPGDVDGLWRIASPTSGAARIKAGFITQSPLTAGDRVFFQTNDSNGTESLWVTNGTVSGTMSIFSASLGGSVSIANRLAGDGIMYYTGDNQLWAVTGPGGRRSLANLPGFEVFPSRGVMLQDRPLLVFDEASRGVEAYILRNVAPVAVADAVTVTRGGTVLINVRANDTDADSAAADLSVSIVTAPSNGSATVEGGSVRYTPSSGFTGTDSFQYRLTDEAGAQSAAATVTVTVNSAPAGDGGDVGSGGGGGGALDLLLLGLLAAAWFHRSRRLFAILR